jgi:subtilisin family serine protease/PKD repeat protein
MKPLAPRHGRTRGAFVIALLLGAAPFLALPFAGANPPDSQLGSSGAPSEATNPDAQGAANHLRDGLSQEPLTGSVSVLVRLQGDPVGSIVIDMEARLGPRALWGAAALEIAGQAIRERLVQLSAQRFRVLDALGGAGFRATPYRDYLLLANGFNLRDLPVAALPLLAAQPDVLLVERDRVLWADLAQSVPLINADDVWALQNATGRNITGEGVVIANIDTGVDYTHPDLGGTLNRTSDFANFTNGTHKKFVGGWDFVNNDNDPWDDHLHGTHVAGIIGANGTIKGVAPGSKQLALKVLSGAGYGYDSDIIAAMEYAADPDGNPLTADGAAASSMSLGGWDPNPDGIEPAAADASTLLGTLCVIAAGNNGATSSVGSPGVSRESLTVGSTTKSDVLSGFSSRGPTLTLDLKPDLVAPGSNIVSTRWGGAGGSLTLSGTSMATPHVSGAVALLRQAHPTWTVAQLKSALVDTAKDLGLSVFDQGGGRLDTLAAVDTSVVSYPYKLAMGRLQRANATTNVTLAFENVGNASVTLNLSAKDVFGMRADMSYVNNNTDLDFVTLSASSITLSPGARANVTVAFAPPASAVPGHYWGAVLANGSNQTVRVPFAYSVRAPILLVDDDSSDRWSGVAPFDNYAGFPSACNNLSWSLDRLNLKHDIFTAVHYTDDGAPIADLLNYPLVIWCTGYDYDYSDSFHTHHSISTSDRVALATYLDSGGQLWLIGENIAWDVFGHANATVPSANFFNAYLGVAHVDNELNTPSPLTGTAGTFMANASYTTAATWTDYGNRGDYATNLTPTPRAFTIFNGSTTDVYGKTYSNASLAVAVDNPTYRSVFWGTEFSWLRNSATYDDAMARTLAFFGPRIQLANSSANEGQRLDFRALLSTLPAPSLYNYTWTFGDGGTANGRNATHVFADDGNYTVTLRVTSGPWLNQTATFNLTVANLPPAIGAANASPAAAFEGQTVNFSAQCTDPGPVDIVDYGWAFGDASANATGNATSHTFANQGNYSVTLTCDDGDGGRVSTLVNVTVDNVAPTVASLLATGTANEGAMMSFASQCHDVGVLDVLTYAWDFGDGATRSGQNSTHTFVDQGRYNVTLTCADGDGGFVSASTVVVVANLPPSASIAASNRTFEGTALALSANASDPGILDILAYAWTFGDGAAAGDLASVQHAFADNGVYLVSLTVTDGDGGATTVNFRVVVDNVAPSAAINITGLLEEGSPVSLSALVSDPGINDTFTYAWDLGDGNFSSLSNSDHSFLNQGAYNVTLRVTDDDGGSSLATVVLTIANAVPAIAVAGPVFADEGAQAFFDGFTADNGSADRLTVTILFGDGSPPVTVDGARGWFNFSHVFADNGEFVVTASVDDGDGGHSERQVTASIRNEWPWFELSGDPTLTAENSTIVLDSMARDAGIYDNVSVTWHFDDGAPDAAGLQISRFFPQDGTFVAHLTATDKDGASNTASITVMVSNLAPSLEVITPTDTLEGSAATYRATTNDPGPLDVVAVRWQWGDGSESTGAVADHTYADVGTYAITVTATDDSPLAPNSTALARVVVVGNVAPTVRSIFALGLLDEGSPLDFTSDITNPPNDALTYAWQFGDGATSNEAEPRHTYTDQGAYAVSLTVTDPEASSSRLTRTLAIANVSPRLDCSLCPGTAIQWAPLLIRTEATDPGVMEDLAFRLTLPNGTSFTSADGSFNVTLTEAGSFDLNLSVADKDGAAANLTYHLVVLPDFDHDGIDNAHDLDDDNDGTPDALDPAPLDPTITGATITAPGALPDWLLLLVGAAGVAAVFLVLRRRRRRDDA